MNRLAVASLPAVSVTRRAADALRGIGDPATLPAADLAALAELDLVDPEGHPTRAGRRLRDDLRGAEVILLYAQRPGCGAARGRLHVGRRQLMYLGSTADDASDATEVLVFPADAVPVLLARWGRLRPAAQDDPQPFAHIDQAAFTRRCTSPAEPSPVGADPDLTSLWAADWRIWGAQCDTRGVSLNYLDAEGFGTYVIRREEDGAVRLDPRPSSLLWGDLQAVLGRLAASPGEL